MAYRRASVLPDRYWLSSVITCSHVSLRRVKVRTPRKFWWDLIGTHLLEVHILVQLPVRSCMPHNIERDMSVQLHRLLQWCQLDACGKKGGTCMNHESCNACAERSARSIVRLPQPPEHRRCRHACRCPGLHPECSYKVQPAAHSGSVPPPPVALFRGPGVMKTAQQVQQDFRHDLHIYIAAVIDHAP